MANGEVNVSGEDLIYLIRGGHLLTVNRSNTCCIPGGAWGCSMIFSIR